MRFYLIILTLALAFSCKTETANNNKPNVNNNSSPKTNSSPNTTVTTVPTYGYEVVNTYKHDPKAFTQGLVFYNDFLYESTGLEGESTLRKVELETGKVLQRHDLSDEVFGEGMTILNDKIYQISWKNGVAFEYDLNFKQLKDFRYSGEGWGLTNDGKNLIMSDGTHVLRVINPENFETLKTITVFRENGQPLMQINELEWVKGEIWANIWQDSSVARIDPETGKVKGWIDFSKLVSEEMRSANEDVLNGIAYDEKTDRIFITGKLWKKLFEIKLKAKS
jgi:glutaminyl-peptide cyclotransferase